MSDFAIRVENLSKRYRIGAKEEFQDTFVGAALSNVKKPLQSWRQLRNLTRFDDGNQSDDVIWALKDVSFEIKRGEVVGIIGRNGAGKSTLLKILSRITYPTSGRFRIRGRVASLLEVGTGFHSELSGRENIYLNGTILGMTKSEVDRKYDEIVDFSGVEKFIDTPVKRYSSGMRVRLAFSVAAHLEPEILLIDEVLAVGDATFQEKCLKRMGFLATMGRTVFLVSHNMGAITSLCSRTLLIEDGRNILDGIPAIVVRSYLENSFNASSSSYTYPEQLDRSAWVESVILKSVDGQNCNAFLMTDRIVIECVLIIRRRSKHTLSVQLKEDDYSPICHFPNRDSSFEIPSSPGRYKINIGLPALNLYPGRYLVRLALTDVVEEIQTEIEDISLRIEQDFSLCPRPLPRQAGLVFSRADWSSELLEPFEE